jgi:hypothetical protein
LVDALGFPFGLAGCCAFGFVCSPIDDSGSGRLCPVGAGVVAVAELLVLVVVVSEELVVVSLGLVDVSEELVDESEGPVAVSEELLLVSEELLLVSEELVVVSDVLVDDDESEVEVEPEAEVEVELEELEEEDELGAELVAVVTAVIVVVDELPAGDGMQDSLSLTTVPVIGSDICEIGVPGATFTSNV